MCQNGGVCVKTTDQLTSATESSCSCPAGTSGVLCESKSICDLQCQHGSSCRNYDDITHDNTGKSSFVCECVGRYKGLECEIPFATCPMIKGGPNFAVECLWGGACVSDEDSNEYTCECPLGRSGMSCERGGNVNPEEDLNSDHDGIINTFGECHSNDDYCKNGGLCVFSHDAKTTAESGVLTKQSTCLCTLGWGGYACELPCTSLNCQHGSSCRFASDDISHGNDSSENGAYCDCSEDTFKGMECEIAVQKCPGSDGVECLYGGSCIGSQEDNGGDFYTCACPPGRMGARCETMDRNYHGGKVYKPQTLSVLKEGINPNVFIISVMAVALFVFLPVTVMIVKKNRKRGAEVQRFTTEGSDDKVTTHESSEDGSEDSAGRLPEDKQIV